MIYFATIKTYLSTSLKEEKPDYPGNEFSTTFDYKRNKMIKYSQRAQKIQSRILEMSQLSEEHLGKNDSGKAFFISSSNKIAQWMNETGLETRLDNIGNVRGRLSSNVPNAKRH